MNREAFEAWAKGRGARDIDFEIKSNGHYAASYIDATWHAWSARDAEVAALKASVAFGDVAVKERDYERHLNAELRAENAELRNRLVNLEDEKNDYINYVGDALGQSHDGESLWDAAQRVLSDRDRVRIELDELRAQIAAHEKVCAGVWVPVEERLPEFWESVVVRPDPDDGPIYITSLQQYSDETKGPYWMDADMEGEPTHWLDARMPGEEEK